MTLYTVSSANGILSRYSVSEIPDDDSDLDAEDRIAAALEDQLSEREEDLLDDIGLDMNEIVSHMAKQVKSFSKDNAEKD